MEGSHSLSHSRLQPQVNADQHEASPTPDQVSDSVVGSIAGAKYKLMSPAKLPISRSHCITIPPGLSPTSFLDSPVLLSNIKAEPSPTTGSFFKPHVMPRTGENPALPLENNFPNGKDDNGETLNSFEFRFHAGASTTSGTQYVGLPIHVASNRNGPASDQGQFISQAHVLSSPAAPVGDDSATCRPTDDLSQEGPVSRNIQSSSSDHKDNIPSSAGERTSDDGYNWRKYGQKLVKGSEFPRSYYKCTYPNCEVKKIFERSPSGQITEIVYKGSHVHPKPQAARRQNSAVLWSAQEDRLNKEFQLTGHDDKFTTSTVDQNGSPGVSPLQANEDGMDGSAPQLTGVNEDNEDDPFLKRRKIEDCMDVTPVIKPIREPRVVVQTVSEVDILDDGYRWRKYGQKVVRGNPNPRSYYKCTNAGCPVRKHVERASHDPKAVITTYEGKHNHDVPTARNNNHDFIGTAAPYGVVSKMRPQDGSTISLDLGFGIGRNRTSNEPTLQSLEADSSTQVPPLYGRVNNSMEGHTFQTLPVHPSNQCPQSLGRILMGP